jgi:hypothetical protein
MIRAVLITIAFLGITTALLAFQPGHKNSNYVKVIEPSPVTQYTPEEEVSRSFALMSGTDIKSASSPTLSLSEPSASIRKVNPVTLSTLQNGPKLQGTASRPTIRSNPAVGGLLDLISAALEQKMTGAQIDLLLDQAEASGAITVPSGWRTAEGKLDTTMLLAALANSAEIISLREGRTHEVRPNESLAGIAYYYYGDPSALEDIFWANRDKLKNPDSVLAGLTLYIPVL